MRNPQDPEQGNSSFSDDSSDDGSLLPSPPHTSIYDHHAAAADSSKHPLRRRKPSRVFTFIATRADKPIRILAMGMIGLVLFILSAHRVLSVVMTRRKWVNAPITFMTRQCPAVEYETLAEAAANNESSGVRICMTTFTDHKSQGVLQRSFRWRDFDGILGMTWENKKSYAERNNYVLFDSSHLIDPTRPPAWTKVRAMQHLLFENPAMDCDWAVWMDADTVVMNPEIRFEDFLPKNTTQHLIVGSDKGGGVNSGVFIFRKSEWSRNFLNQWWNMTSYIQPPGLSKSGDNTAMKALLVNPDHHVIIPPRCTLNSFAEYLSAGQFASIMDKLDLQHWFMSPDYYHKSDFIAHVAGFDNKAECIKLLLDAAAMHAKEQQPPSTAQRRQKTPNATRVSSRES